jgi:excisionase family DNA binding protein
MLDPDAPALIPHGSPALKRTSGYIDEEFLASLKGKKGMAMYREMADNDAVIGTSLWIIESLCRQVEWETEESQTGHPLAAWGAEFAESLFDDCETTWRSKVGELLTFDIFGHAIVEPEFKIRRGDASDPLLYSRHDDGLFGWADWGFRPQESIERWVFDDTGRIAGAVQYDPSTGAINHMPIDRLLLFRVRARKGNPEGYSMLRPAYIPYYYAKRLRDVEAIGLERNIAGMPDYQLPARCFQADATDDEKAALAAARDMVKKIRVDAYYGVVRQSETDENGQPTGHKFQLMSSSGKSFADTSPIITRYETRAAQVFMTEFIMSGTGSSQSGSHSLHSDKTSMLAMACGAQLDIIDDITNTVALPQIWRLNDLPMGCMPMRKHGDIEKQQIIEVFNAVTTAVSQGAMQGDEDVENLLRRLVSLKPREGGSIMSMLEQAVSDHSDLGSVGGVPRDPAVDEPEPEPEPEQPSMWTAEEAAAEMRVSPAVIRNAVRSGKLPGAPIGRSYRVDRKAVEDMVRGGYSQ